MSRRWCQVWRTGFQEEMDVLGLSAPKEKGDLGTFTSSEKVSTRSCGGRGTLTSSERASNCWIGPQWCESGNLWKPGVSSSHLPHRTATENILTIHQRSHSESRTVWSAPVPCDAAVSPSKQGFVFHPLKGAMDKSLFSRVRNTCSVCSSQIQGTNAAPSRFSEGYNPQVSVLCSHIAS